MTRKVHPLVNKGGRMARASMRKFLKRQLSDLVNTPRDPLAAIAVNAERKALACALAFLNASARRNNQRAGGLGR